MFTLLRVSTTDLLRKEKPQSYKEDLNELEMGISEAIDETYDAIVRTLSF